MAEIDVFRGGLRGQLVHLDGGVVYALAGEMDLTNAAEMITHLRGLTDGHGHRLDLDLSGVTYIDSTGLRWLIEINDELASSGGRLCLVGLSPAVERLMRLTASDGLFCIRRG